MHPLGSNLDLADEQSLIIKAVSAFRNLAGPSRTFAQLWQRKCHSTSFLLSALTACLFAPFAFSQTIPAERPRARPPSALTGWADWENGEALLKRLEVPPAPILAPAGEVKTFRLAPGYRIELVAAEPL